MNEFYAVVKCGGPKYSFTKLHDTLRSAQSEAARLCEIEKCQFAVLKVVGYVDLKCPPVMWRLAENVNWLELPKEEELF